MVIDVTLKITSATALPRTDVIGYTDPYVLLHVVQGASELKIKTGAVYNAANPAWSDEEVHLSSVQPSCSLHFEVYDHNTMYADAFNCSTSSQCIPMDLPQFKYGPPGSWTTLDIGLVRTNGQTVPGGCLTVQLSWSPAKEPEAALMHRGPVRYRVTLSPLIGKMIGIVNDDWREFAAFKLKLCETRRFFPEGRGLHWNEAYKKAAQLFRNPAAVLVVKAQHALLYTDKKENGLLRDGAALLQLLNNGVRGGEARYFTFVVMGDSMRFSETGAQFLSDMLSKHAMHANCSEEVLFAGEFCVLSSLTQPGGYRFIVDNNSGTFAPPPSCLAAMGELLRFNFPGLEVEVISSDDPVLEQLHAQVPSRRAPK